MKRSLTRIDPALKEIRAIWVPNQDLRLTQMLWNVREVALGDVTTISGFYNMEDDVLLARLREQYGCYHTNTEFLGMSKRGHTYHCRNCQETVFHG